MVLVLDCSIPFIRMFRCLDMFVVGGALVCVSVVVPAQTVAPSTGQTSVLFSGSAMFLGLVLTATSLQNVFLVSSYFM